MIQYQKVSQYDAPDLTTTKKDWYHMVISPDVEKIFDKIQHPFMIKAVIKVGIDKTYLNIKKDIYDTPTANMTLNIGKLNIFI